jgi:hypothetical protein
MFSNTLFEYLGYHMTTSGIRPFTSKMEAIQQLKLPKTLKQLRSLIGLINYYQYVEATVINIDPAYGICSMLRGRSQLLVVIYFRLFLELDLVCQTGM